MFQLFSRFDSEPVEDLKIWGVGATKGGFKGNDSLIFECSPLLGVFCVQKNANTKKRLF
jgi:hypothetical protein